MSIHMVRWLRKEFFHILPVFLFFLIMFNVINTTERFLFEKAGLTPFTFLNVLVAAALVAKIVLVIDHLPATNLPKHKPLIYNIIWKTIVYTLITLVVRLAIQLTPYLFSGRDLRVDYQLFSAAMNWRLFTAIQIWYLMLFFLFVTARELTEVIGYLKMRKIFFGR